MDLLENVRLKMRGKTNLRNAVRISGGIFSGVLAGIFRNWAILFILISAYCLFEMVIHLLMIRSNILYENRFSNYTDSGYPNEKKRINGEYFSVAFIISIKKFFRSFILMTVIGAICKLLVDFFIFL